MVRDGWVMVVPLGILALGCLLVGYLVSGTIPGAIWIVPAAVFTALALFTGFFFRNPDRSVPPGEGLVVSGGDGKVVAVTELAEDSFIGGPARQISVFLSVLNVHVNRIPITGVVKLRQRIDGRFKLAFKDEASGDNARVILGIEGDDGRVLIKQIVGFVARRIVCNVHEGDKVRIGDRFGLIRFGSRIDVVVPAGTEIRVKPGDRVRGGETILGVLK